MIFTADVKLGHYMKIPPRVMFWAQIIATAVAGTVQLGVQSWYFIIFSTVTMLLTMPCLGCLSILRSYSYFLDYSPELTRFTFSDICEEDQPQK